MEKVTMESATKDLAELALTDPLKKLPDVFTAVSEYKLSKIKQAQNPDISSEFYTYSLAVV